MDQLSASGIPREKLCFVNPAHDNIIRPRKTVIGLTSKIHADGRKRENHLVEIAEKISPDDFMFKIMGAGWESIVDSLTTMGFAVEYYDHFDYDTYVSLVPTFDYYLYLSFDEGSMGYLDALAAGVKTIVTPQGYHLDASGGITYPVNSTGDIVAAFEKIAEEKRSIVRSVSSWTWSDYAKKHVAIWEYLMKGRDSKFVLNQCNQCNQYQDGLRSVLHEHTSPVSITDRLRSRMEFIKNSHSYFNLLARCKSMLRK